MPTVAEFVELIADRTGEPLPTVRMMARRLVDDDVLPKATGRRVPRITHQQAAMLLLAVLAGPPVKDATRRATTYGALLHNGQRGGTALEAVVYLLRRLPKDPAAPDWSIEVCTNFPQLVLKQKPHTPQMPHPSERTDSGDLYIPSGEDLMHWPSDDLKRFAVLSGIRLHDIACALAGDE
jgi:hypothetical protein